MQGRIYTSLTHAKYIFISTIKHFQLKHARLVFYFYQNKYIVCLFIMVFNATFNNISVISWQSLLLVEETGGPGENHRPITC